jgi:hypothetical protein
LKIDLRPTRLITESPARIEAGALEFNMSNVIPFPQLRKTDRLTLARLYRLEASRLGALADSDLPLLVTLGLAQQALRWIQLAENEEFMAEEEANSIVGGGPVRR